jgi:GAF domain-containing protein
VLNEDLTAVNGRWPHLAPIALDAGFRSVHALPMRLRGHTIGALNLFRTRQGAFEPADVLAGQALADIATIAILQHRATLEARLLNQQLSVALDSRIVIEQAKGMFAERTGVDMDHAFARLRGHARSHNQRLIDVAQSFVDGTLAPTTLTPTTLDAPGAGRAPGRRPPTP